MYQKVLHENESFFLLRIFVVHGSPSHNSPAFRVYPNQTPKLGPPALLLLPSVPLQPLQLSKALLHSSGCSPKFLPALYLMSSTLNGRKFSKGGASIISSYCVDQSASLAGIRIDWLTDSEPRILENLVANVMFTNFTRLMAEAAQFDYSSGRRSPSSSCGRSSWSSTSCCSFVGMLILN